MNMQTLSLISGDGHLFVKMTRAIGRLSITPGAILLYGLGFFYVEAYGADGTGGKLNYPIVDTGQDRCFGNSEEIAYPGDGNSFFGQDAQYEGHAPAYKDNGDGTVTDRVTGLMWQKDPGKKKTFMDAVKGAPACNTGGYRDWRLPTIKELYSLILFSGIDPDARSADTSRLKPFIDTRFFSFEYGNPGNPGRGERIIDSQFATSTKYVHKTMHGNDTMFGVNFADGRIKGYPMKDPRGRGDKKFHVLYVRGNNSYGKNRFVDNQDGTIADQATGLTWMQLDSGHLKAGKNKDGKLNWEAALKWAEDLEYARHSDWRLPNAKELQSIVDYSRSPATTRSPAINKIFKTSTIKENARADYPYYWTGTTHKRDFAGRAAVYIAFGTGFGWMENKRSGKKMLLDVHGAGCQRSDPKSGDPRQYPHGRGPQGDVLRIYNFVRCVRGGQAAPKTTGPEVNAGTGSGQAGHNDPERWQRRPRNFVGRLDKDGDGRVSRREFDGPPDRFDTLDKNGDGFLGEGESPKGPPPRGGKPPRPRM